MLKILVFRVTSLLAVPLDMLQGHAGVPAPLLLMLLVWVLLVPLNECTMADEGGFGLPGPPTDDTTPLPQ